MISSVPADRPTTNSVPSGAGHQVADDAGEDYGM